MKRILPFLLVFLFAACQPSTGAPASESPTATVPFDTPTKTKFPTLTRMPTFTPTETPPPSATPRFFAEMRLSEIPGILAATEETFSAEFCEDTRGLQLVLDFVEGVRTRNSDLFIEEGIAIETLYLREGNPVSIYDTSTLFTSSEQFEWGIEPGSGNPLTGPFRTVVLPSLDLVLESDPIVKCNELRLGETTYNPAEPPVDDYYSFHFPGADAAGRLDWQTWVMGIVRHAGAPMAGYFSRYAWEP